MTKSSIMINLDDPRSDKIADAISNKTSKKILSLLAEREMSPSELAEELKLPLNTIGYNLKKLVAAELITKSKKFFWSAKGKRIEFYKLSNKKIIISPRSMIRGVIPTLLITGAMALGIKLFTDIKYASQQSLLRATDIAAESTKALDTQVAAGAARASGEAAATASSAATTLQDVIVSVPAYWTWFLLGALTALLIILVWNWRQNK